MNWQTSVFYWVAHQPTLTGLAIFAAGLVFGFVGYRMIRYLIGLPSAGVGALLAGLLAWQFPDIPPGPLVGGSAILAGVLGLAFPRPAVVICSAATWAALGAYIATQFGMKDMPVLITAGVLGGSALLLTLISRQPMMLVMTTLLGAGLLIVGFVGVASGIMPGMAATFRGMAAQYSVIVPVLLLMISVMAYSCQALARQGDMVTGAQAQPRV